MPKLSRLKLRFDIWALLSLIFIFLIAAPNINILIHAFNEGNENWSHLREYLLADYILNTLILLGFTGLFTVFIGTSLSWIISVYDFPLRNFFKWCLVLPLDIPPYMSAYTYRGLLNYTGVIQSFLRNNLNLSVNQKYFDIMTMEGAIFIFTLFLYPYVYIITRSFLAKQSASLIENARILGSNSLEIFFHVVLPVSRAAIIGGVSLVLLEVLNDYGVVKYYGIPTFSTAIFQTWFGMGDVDTAVKLAAMLMSLVLVILLLENLLRGRKKFSYTTSKVRPIATERLTGHKAFLAFGYCLLIFGLGVLVPVLQLVHWTFLTYDRILKTQFWELTLDSFLVTLVSSLLIVVIAVIIANYCRLSNNFTAKIYSRATTMGYSIPGAVIAMAVIISVIALDNKLYWFYQAVSPGTGKLVLSTSITMLIFAYTIRFLAIAYNSVQAGFERVGNTFTEASRTLGMTVTQSFFKVDFHLVRPAIFSAFILVFVDILKELPLTMILRPFNFDTLATKSFEFANNEMVHEASMSSLIIIVISAVSIYFFNKLGDKEGT